MKHIDLKVFGETDGKAVGYREWLTRIVTTPANGADYNEMRSRIRVLDALNKAEQPGALSLEDADYETLKSCVLPYKFPVVDVELFRMVEDVIGAGSGSSNPT